VVESTGEKLSVQPKKAKVATAPAAKNLFNCMVTVLSIQESKDTTKQLLAKHHHARLHAHYPFKGMKFLKPSAIRGISSINV
jgi:hypothetical protein